MSAARSRIDTVTLVADLVGALVAAAVGFGAGIVLTFTHRQFAPWGLVAGLAIVVMLLVGFRLVFGGRLVAAAAAIGVLLATAILALPGAGGSVLVVADALGYVWALGPTAIAVVVVGWPRLGDTRRPRVAVDRLDA